MRNRESIIEILDNGISVKGSYKHSQLGTYFDLYVLAKDGSILGRHSLGTTGLQGSAEELLRFEVKRIVEGLRLYKADMLNNVSIQLTAVGYVLRVLYPKTTRMLHAA